MATRVLGRSASGHLGGPRRSRSVAPSEDARGPSGADGKGAASEEAPAGDRVDRADRGEKAEKKDERRKQILQAAVKVFADKGYHGCRISDVADEAGVAYGLVYHYFGTKEGLLSAIFDTNWGFFAKAVEQIAATDARMIDKLRQVIELAFQAFEMSPLVVKVLVLEYGRNARFGDALENPQVARVFRTIEGIFEEGRREGELKEGIDPRAMSVLFTGSLETAFVSSVLAPDGKGPDDRPAASLSAMKSTLMGLLQRGALGA